MWCAVDGELEHLERLCVSCGEARFWCEEPCACLAWFVGEFVVVVAGTDAREAPGVVGGHGGVLPADGDDV